MQELALDINITASHSNTEFTCRVSFYGGLTASDTITISVNGIERKNCIQGYIKIICYRYSPLYKCGSN